MIPEYYSDDRRAAVINRLDTIVSERYETVPEYDGVDAPDISSFDDFRQIPFLTDEQAITRTDSVDVFFMSQRQHAETTKTTSGTSSDRPTMCFWGEADIECSKRTVLRMLEGEVTAEDRAVVVTTEQFAAHMRRPYQALDIPAATGNPYDLAFTRDIIRAMEPTCLFSTPSIGMKLGEALEGGEVAANIEHILFHGEPLTGAQRRDLQEYFPHAQVRQLLGSSETSTYGFQCSTHRAEQQFHVPLDDFFVEVVDPETGEPCGVGEKGEIVVTSLVDGSTVPVVRYRTGDQGKWVERECNCSGSELLLHIHGRMTFDSIKVGGISVYRDRFEDALEAASDLVRGRYQLHVREQDDATPFLEVKAVPRQSFDNREGAERQAAQKIMRNFQLSPDYTWKDAVRKEVLAPLEVTFVDELSSSVKNRPVVDHRGE